jgi:hypothetical protein
MFELPEMRSLGSCSEVRAREFLLDALANDLSGIGRVLLDPRLESAAVRLLELGRILPLHDDVAIAGNERSSVN